MSVKQVTRDFLKLVQTIAGIDQNEFPERLGAMFIINVPSIFPFVFRGVKPFLDPETVKKFQIYAKPAEWVPALHEIVDPGTLPPKYGGTGPELPSFTDMNDIIADLQAGGSGIGVAPRTSEEKLRDREGRRASDQRTASVRLRHLDSGHSLDSDYSRHTVYFDASFEIVDVDCCGRVKSLRDPRPMAARRGTPNESSTFRIDTERGNRTEDAVPDARSAHHEAGGLPHRCPDCLGGHRGCRHRAGELVFGARPVGHVGLRRPHAPGPPAPAGLGRDDFRREAQPGLHESDPQLHQLLQRHLLL
eukprot:scaffold1234_cov248-Pinguiococcus_pyrenoidosus.AAC.18